MKVALALALAITGWANPAPTAEPPSPPTPFMPVLVDQPPVPTIYQTALFGTATWFDAERGNQTTWYTRKGITLYGAAGPGLRALVPDRYKQNYGVRVTFLATGVSVDVRVVDWCSCNGTARRGDERLIDLAPAVWRAAGYPLGYGVAKIRLDVLP